MGANGLLTTQEVAEQMRVHVSTVARWVKEGHLAAFRTPGGTLRFRQADVDALLTSEPKAPVAS